MSSRAAVLSVAMGITSCAARAESVVAGRVRLPVAYDVDVVVAGGSLAAVEAACAAAGEGASVFLLAARPYLGRDLCATQRLWLEKGERPATELTKRVFGDARVATPYRVKSALDEALVASGVQFLTGCFATDVLVGPDGAPAGIVMSNRSGRQAVRAKVVIDATVGASLARRAGARFRRVARGTRPIRHVVVGGKAVASVPHRTLDVAYESKGERYPVYEYSLRVPMADGDFRSLVGALNRARGVTHTKGVVDSSEMVFHVPEATIVSPGLRTKDWPGAAAVDVSLVRPAGIEALYVLSAYADLGADQLERALRPCEHAAVGRRIGASAAAQAARLPRAEKVDFGRTGAREGVARVREHLTTVRFRDKPSLELGMQRLPVLASVDVVVIGGGTSGASAAIGASRAGARTLVVEYLDELGGVGTAGLIGAYWYGNRTGFTAEIDRRFGERWNVIERAEWLRREIVRNRGEVWFGCFGCGALVKSGRVVGVLVATPIGAGVVRAKVVIDSTGNADIAAAAGARTQFSISSFGGLSVQLAGYPRRELGDSYNNSAFTMVDDTDVFDRWHLLYHGRRGKRAYDVGQLIDTRDRRRVVGEYVLKTTDILNARTYPDTICHMRSNFDAAAFPDSEMLLVRDMKGPVYSCDFPYRCLLPKGLDGILVTGLGASTERDAMTLTRMQPDLQNQGFAAGVAAGLAARRGGSTRRLDVRALQTALVRKGIARARVLTDRDSYPLGASTLARNVATLAGLTMEIGHESKKDDATFHALAAVMSHPRKSIPYLKRAYRAAADEKTKITYARVLAVLGDDAGLPTLLRAVSGKSGWGKGYGLTEHRATKNTFVEIDRLVIALGFTRSPEARPVLLEKLALLDADGELSHFKAICLALRLQKHESFARPLAALLDKPKMSGHARDAVYYTERSDGDDPLRVSRRAREGGDPNRNGLNSKFRELLVAALLFECGDVDGKGRAILEAYTRDVHGHFARYARYVLDSVTASPSRP